MGVLDERSFGCSDGIGGPNSYDSYTLTIVPTIVTVNSQESCRKLCEMQDAYCRAYAFRRGGTTCRIIPLNKYGVKLSTPLKYDTSFDVYMKTEFQEKRTASSFVKVHLTDVNEAPRLEAGSRYVAENSAIGTSVGKPILAPDDDNDGVTFAIEGWFDQTNAWGDAPHGTEYNGFKKTTSSGKPCQSWKSTTFAPEVENNGNHNYCRNPDNSKSGPWCFFDDQNREPCFVYHEGAHDKIKITSDGLLKVKDNSLDFETISSYTLIISSVDDNRGGSMVTTKPITVVLVDLNEPPVMEDQFRDCNESHVAGSSIGDSLVASEIDADQVLRMVITSGDPNFLFAINPNLQLVLTNSLDFETAKVHDLSVKVIDSGEGALTDEATITVYVHNVNEPPEFPSELSYERFIHENSPNRTLVRGGAVTARDPDFEDSQILRYTLLGSRRMDNNEFEVPRFEINSISGVMTSTDELLDFETSKGWYVTIQATDGEFDCTVNVAVNVLDVNEPPIINVTFSGMSLNENFQPGDKIGTPIVAFDVDGDNLAYSIINGNQDQVFSIDALTGQLVVNKGPSPYQVEEVINGHSVGCKNCDCLVDASNRYCRSCNKSGLEETYVYASNCYICHSNTRRRDGKCISNDWLNASTRTITVQVTDSGSARNGGTSSLFVMRHFVLTITPANDPPALPDVTYLLPENSKIDTLVGVVRGEDPENHKLSYRILKGNLDETFELDRINGKLTLNNYNSNNFEINPRFFLTVEAMDNGEGNMTDICIVTILIVDVNERPSIANTYREVEENRFEGDLVGLPLQAHDVDADDVLTYTIVDGNDNNMFLVETLTGQIRVARKGLNYEEKADYELTIEVSDKNGLKDSAAVFIALKDINDPPMLEILPRQILENSASGTLIGTAIASIDEDAMDTASYAISKDHCQNIKVDTDGFEELSAPLLHAQEKTMPFSTDSNSGSLHISEAYRDLSSGQKYVRMKASMESKCLHYGWPVTHDAVSDPVNVEFGRVVGLAKCEQLFHDRQMWVCSSKDLRMRLAMYPDYCLHATNVDQGLQSDHKLSISACDNRYALNQRFAVVGSAFCLNDHPDYCISAASGGLILRNAGAEDAPATAWVMEDGEAPSSPNAYTIDVGEEIALKKCTSEATNILSNSFDWLDLQNEGIGSGWSIYGNVESAAVKMSKNCDSKGFQGRYQYVSSSSTAILSHDFPHISISIRSEGCDDSSRRGNKCGEATIFIDSFQLSLKKRGVNLVSINPETRKYESKSFDTHASVKETALLGKYLKSLPMGTIVAVATQNDACKQFSISKFSETENELKKLGIPIGDVTCGRGTDGFENKYFRSSFAAIHTVGGTIHAFKQNFRYSKEATIAAAIIPLSNEALLEAGREYILTLDYRSSVDVIAGGGYSGFTPILANSGAQMKRVVRRFSTSTAGAFKLAIVGGWLEIDNIIVTDPSKMQHRVCQIIQSSENNKKVTPTLE